MRVLGISGSLRAGSHNTRLLRAAGELFDAAGAELSLYDGLKAVPPYDEDDSEPAPAAVAHLR
ncbi:MAG: NAD(P)H-dependent oxidoreductase, partial [Actinobacteria bacterium]|nr:NAD(P)H-dependent oxidoreductase [Actinomycetota bacterium]